MTSIALDDATLVALVDGELDAAVAERVHAALLEDPEARGRLDVLRETGLVLRRLGADDRRRQQVWARRGSLLPRTFSLAAACVAGLAAGVVLGGAARDLLAPPAVVVVADADAWMDEFAGYFAIYADDPHRPVELGPEHREQIAAWFSGRLGAEVVVPDLTAQGLAFLGGRLMAVESQPSGMLMYTDALGLRWGLCVTPGRHAPAEPIQRRRMGLGLGTWSAGGLTFVVMGDAPDDRITAVTRAAKAAFERT